MFRSIAKTALLAGFALTLATGAMAQQEPSKEHLAAARAAIEASRVTEGFDNILLNVAQQTKAMYQRGNPSITQDIEDATNKVAIEIAPRRTELDRQIQIAWAAKFSKQELDDIAKFYNSPVGKKLATETQNMVRTATEAVLDWQQKISTDMVSKVREELKKRGHKL
jgi:hypothetical protein